MTRVQKSIGADVAVPPTRRRQQPFMEIAAGPAADETRGR
ncbi:hypothetical protein ACVWZ7_001907 [Arthrobacter sp. TE12232]